jgi:hypothetical protein
MGKRGGIRVKAAESNVVLMITAYAKSEKEDLSDADRTAIRRIVESFQGSQ